MRIESIRLVNWGPYAEAHLDLSDIKSLMVTGQNGHGKSMLIDAITWCTWNECRSKSVDDLVKQGSDGCEVEEVFSTGGHRYRILRSRSLKGRGTSGLRFWRVDGVEESLDGANIRDTEARIGAVIGLPFDVASATSFMMQGKSDSLSKATRQERLGVLNKLLRNERFEAWRDQAREERRGIEERVATAEGKIEAQRPSVHAGVAAAEERRQLDGALVDAARGVDDALAAYQAASEALQRARIEKAEVDAARAAWTRANSTVKSKRMALAALQALKEGLERRVAAARAQSGPVDTLRADHEKAKATLEEAEAQGRAVSEEIEELTLNDSTAANEQTRLRDGLRARMDAWKAENAQRERQASRLVSDAAVAMNQAHATLDAAEKDAALLDGVPCGGQGAYASCRFLVRALQQKASLPDARAAADGSADVHGDAVAKLAEIQKAVEPEDLAAEKVRVLQAVADLDAKRAGMGESRRTLDQRRASLRTMWQTCKGAVDEAYRVLHAAELAGQEIAGLEEQIQTRRGELAAADAEIAVLDLELQGLAAARFVEDVDAVVYARTCAGAGATAAKDTAERALATVRLRAGVLDERVRVGEEAAGRIRDIEVETKANHAAIAQLKTLEQAYKDAPLLILEVIIPEIEQAANRLLAKVSISGMRVELVTQKATKSGDKIADTLDIMISDTEGSREYSCYSGGERFLVDFCLRIALAWVLANRANAPLETIICDEGPSSLDKRAVAAFSAMLSAVGEMFPLTILISHIPELIDAFPARLVVEKGDDGSSFRLER